MTERKEDGVKFSEEDIERIKKEKEEREEIDLLLNEMVNDSSRGYMNKIEQEDVDEFLNSMINEELSESSTKSRYEFQLKIPKRKRSALAITDQKAPKLDPLQIAMEMVMEYHDFVEYTLQVLSEERGDAEIEMQKWNKLINRGNRLIESMNPRMERLPREMERMQKDENLQKEYAFRQIYLEDILRQLRDINARIESSAAFCLVSNMSYTELVLPHCLKILRNSKEELIELIQVIEGLKEINKVEDGYDFGEETEHIESEES